jgi:hypothetical protein
MFKKSFILQFRKCRINAVVHPFIFKMGGLVAFLLGLSLLPACQTIAPLPPINTNDAGWSVREGQAIWKPKKTAPEIAGELLVATHPDGRSLVQFTKTPIPFVVAQTTTNSWQIHFVPNNKTYSGRGRPPSQLAWLHLARCLAGIAPPKFWHWKQLENGNWRLENHYTGESLEGYLSP